MAVKWKKTSKAESDKPLQKAGVKAKRTKELAKVATPEPAPVVVVEAPREATSTLSAKVTKNAPLDVLSRRRVDVEKERKKLNVLPSYACSTCMINVECPEFKEGYVCAFEEQFKAFDTREMDGVLGLMREVLDTNKQRMFFAVLNERITRGGDPDPNVTRLTETVMGQAQELVRLQQEADRISVDLEESGPAGEEKPGILTMLFGGGGKAAPKELEEPRRVPADVGFTTTAEEHEATFVGREADTRDVVETQGEAQDAGAV